MNTQNFAKAFLFSFQLLFRPIKNFYRLKRERIGKVSVGLLMVVLVIVTFILKRQLTRFMFQDPLLDPSKLNILSEALGVLVPFFLWCVANWSFTTLMDGEGSFKDIVMVSGYALFPVVLINLPLIALSWFLTMEEQGFYFMLDSISVIWTMLLLFISNLVVHQYTVKKTLAMIVLTIIGMGLIAFIALLFSTLIQQMYAFLYSIYKELIFRI